MVDLGAFTPEQQAQLRAALEREHVERRAFFDLVKRALLMIVRWIERAQ